MEYTLRKATKRDKTAIRALIREGKINPVGINWKRFILAVDENNEILGCGQIKTHWDHSHELASIAVNSQMRGKGIATAIIQYLIANEENQLFLTCRASLEGFYSRFGFQVVYGHEMPIYFNIIHKLSQFLSRTGIFRERILVMRYSK